MANNTNKFNSDTNVVNEINNIIVSLGGTPLEITKFNDSTNIVEALCALGLIIGNSGGGSGGSGGLDQSQVQNLIDVAINALELGLNQQQVQDLINASLVPQLFGFSFLGGGTINFMGSGQSTDDFSIFSFPAVSNPSASGLISNSTTSTGERLLNITNPFDKECDLNFGFTGNIRSGLFGVLMELTLFEVNQQGQITRTIDGDIININSSFNSFDTRRKFIFNDRIPPNLSRSYRIIGENRSFGTLQVLAGNNFINLTPVNN